MATPIRQPLSNWEAFVLAIERSANIAESVAVGSDVSAGAYRCSDCGYRLEVSSTQTLSPCPRCDNGALHPASGGDSVRDPYPDR
jgi:predicted Zn-ribbon and HTH transcriptional regulator